MDDLLTKTAALAIFAGSSWFLYRKGWYRLSAFLGLAFVINLFRYLLA